MPVFLCLVMRFVSVPMTGFFTGMFVSGAGFRVLGVGSVRRMCGMFAAMGCLLSVGAAKRTGNSQNDEQGNQFFHKISLVTWSRGAF